MHELTKHDSTIVCYFHFAGSVTAIVIILIVSLLMIIILILWYRQRFKATGIVSWEYTCINKHNNLIIDNNNIIITFISVEPEEVVYDEPYPLPLRPKTELQMEACPAYGIVLSSGTHPQ